jgi:hypothetical protein
MYSQGGFMYRILFLFTVMSVFFFSCSSQQMLLRKGDTGVFETEPTIDRWVNFYFWGLAPATQLANPFDICVKYGKEAVAAETRHSFLNGLASGVTYGLYAPARLKVWCQ